MSKPKDEMNPTNQSYEAILNCLNDDRLMIEKIIKIWRKNANASDSDPERVINLGKLQLAGRLNILNKNLEKNAKEFPDLRKLFSPQFIQELLSFNHAKKALNTKSKKQDFNTHDMNSLIITGERIVHAIDQYLLSQKIIQTNADVIIISAGSAGSQKQQIPPFARELAASGKLKILILNVDPYFLYEDTKGIEKKELPHNLELLYFATFFGRSEKMESNLATDELLEPLNATNMLCRKAIEESLTKKNKHVVLQNFFDLGNNITSLAKDLGKKQNDKMGSQLEIIGGYDDILPVMIYSKHFFTQQNLETNINSIISKHGGIDLYKTSQYEAAKQDMSHIGVLVRNLDAISASDLFKESSTLHKKLEETYSTHLIFQTQNKPLNLNDIQQLLKNGKTKEVIEYIERNKEILNSKDENGRTLAHLAVLENPNDDTSLIEFLVKQNMDLTSKDLKGDSPLALAWYSGPKTTETLIKKGVHEKLTKKELESIFDKQLTEISAAELNKQEKGLEANDLIFKLIRAFTNKPKPAK